MTRIRSGLSWASTKKEERESGSWKVVALASRLLLNQRVKDQAYPTVIHPNGKLSKNHPGTRVPFALCYLCFLLFKFSLLPSVRHNFRGLHR
jgi:hypothetical protein